MHSSANYYIMYTMNYSLYILVGLSYLLFLLLYRYVCISILFVLYSILLLVVTFAVLMSAVVVNSKNNFIGDFGGGALSVFIGFVSSVFTKFVVLNIAGQKITHKLCWNSWLRTLKHYRKIGFESFRDPWVLAFFDH